MDTRAADELYMRAALAEAERAAQMGEVPIGAVVVCGSDIVARAHNTREHDHDPSAHAEFRAMVDAARALGRWRLAGCTVYVTLEPCIMCAGLMVNARIDRCVYGASDPKAGALGSLYDLSCDARLNHAFSVTAGVLADRCADQLHGFFLALRARGESEGAKRDRTVLAEMRESAPSARQPRAPRVVLALDPCLGGREPFGVEGDVERGVLDACPAARVAKTPVSGSVDGALAALARAWGVDGHDAGPGSPMLQVGERAVIAAKMDGPIDPGRATSRRAGELLLKARQRGATTIYVVCDGAYALDGGAGCLQALGAVLLDETGDEIGPGPVGLARLSSIDLEPARHNLAGCEVVVLANGGLPLVGRRGAARTHGRVMGARVDDLDAHMIVYGRSLDAARRRAGLMEPDPLEGRRPASVLGLPGGGTAGGLAAALFALGARVEDAYSAMLDLVGMDDVLKEADVVVASGDAGALARRANRAHVPLIMLVDGDGDELDRAYRAGAGLAVPLWSAGPRRAGEQAMRAFLLS